MILIQQLLKINVMKYFKILMISVFILIFNIAKAQYTINRADSAQMAGDARLAINLYQQLNLVDNNLLNMATSYAQLGLKDSAIFYLDKQKKHFFTLPVAIICMPAFKSLQGNNKWEGLKRSIEDNYFRNKPELDKDLVRVIWEMYANDQLYRERMGFFLTKYGKGSVKMDSIWRLQYELDSINQIELNKLIEKSGWPTKSSTGYQIASMAPYFVVQHTRDIDLQKNYLNIIFKVIKHEKEDGADYADLVDQILIKEGKKQKYGTQLNRNKITGKLELCPLENKSNVDTLRQELGLLPLSDFLEMNEVEYEK